jgi:hypothetical protein
LTRPEQKLAAFAFSLQRGQKNSEGIGNNQTSKVWNLARVLGLWESSAETQNKTTRAKKLKHMYQSNQITNNNQLVNKSPYRLSLTPWTAAIGLAIAMFLSPSGAFATISNFPSWELASEFNDCNNPDAANPSGVWSYGWKPITFGSFTLFTDCVALPPFPDISGWTTSGGLNFLQVSHNVHSVTLVGSGSQATLPPHALYLHPGSVGEYAVVRFTAPVKGVYKLSGQFYALDDNGSGTITDVWILQNNITTVYSSNVNYYGGAKFASFTSKMVQLQAGQTLDFEVGFGSDMNYGNDTTGLNAVIEKIK